MNIHFPTIETERVILRLLSLQDSEQVFTHFADPFVTEFMDIEPCKQLQDAIEIIQFHIDDTGCRWGIFDKSSGNLLGTCGYHCWTTHGQAKAEIGFDLAKEYWGKGLMSESLKPVIDFGFADMALQRIEATVDPCNERSIKLLKKHGFVEEGTIEPNLLLYALTN